MIGIGAELGQPILSNGRNLASRLKFVVKKEANVAANLK